MREECKQLCKKHLPLFCEWWYVFVIVIIDVLVGILWQNDGGYYYLVGFVGVTNICIAYLVFKREYRRKRLAKIASALALQRDIKYIKNDIKDIVYGKGPPKNQQERRLNVSLLN